MFLPPIIDMCLHIQCTHIFIYKVLELTTVNLLLVQVVNGNTYIL